MKRMCVFVCVCVHTGRARISEKDVDRYEFIPDTLSLLCARFKRRDHLASVGSRDNFKTAAQNVKVDVTQLQLQMLESPPEPRKVKRQVAPPADLHTCTLGIKENPGNIQHSDIPIEKHQCCAGAQLLTQRD